MNREQLILSPTGKPLVCVGANAREQFVDGDYVVSMEWDIDPQHTEPCMVIWSKYAGRHSGAFAICLSSIGKYADPSGSPTPQAFIECWRALPTLGRAQIDMEVYRLLDVILRHTPDLIRMPPVPVDVVRREAREPLLEITRKNQDGKTLDEAVV